MPPSSHTIKVAGVIVVLLLLLAGIYVYFSRPDSNDVGNNGLIEPDKRVVQLYFYNEDEDRRLGGDGNPLCSSDAVLPVESYIDRTNTPIQDTIRLLLQGVLTQEEIDNGFNTEFPLEGFSLVGANLQNGVLTLEFSDPNNKTVGGSCRVGLLWAQIQKTAEQFDEVQEVKFIPEELFQP